MANSEIQKQQTYELNKKLVDLCKHNPDKDEALLQPKICFVLIGGLLG